MKSELSVKWMIYDVNVGWMDGRTVLTLDQVAI